jgi:superfamily II DNA or RNA helicase
MPLHDFQKQALDEIKHLFNQGCRRQILSMPTGLGKTVIFTQVHRALNLKKKVLVIAHRGELVQQAAKHYKALGYRFTVDKTDKWYENVSKDKKIWIATVQSLTHRLSKRVERFNPIEFDLVICDEAHHSVASSYMSICNHFGITNDKFEGLFLGVTATPIRNDGRCLGQLFDKAVCVMDTFTAIEKGWLVGIRYFQAHSNVGLNSVPTRRSGDFNKTALGTQINQDVRNSLIVKAWENQAKGKRTIVFCATVQHAANVAETFRDHKIKAQSIHGDLSTEERKRILSEHREGNITPELCTENRRWRTCDFAAARVGALMLRDC